MSDAGPTLTGEEHRVRRRSAWARFLPLAAMIALAAIGYVLGWHRYLSLEHIVAHYDRLQTSIATHYWLSLALYASLYIVVVALSLPGGAVATLAGGLLFGWLVGGTVAVVAATIGAMIVFLIVKTSIGRLLAEHAGPWLARLKAGFDRNALSYMLFLRLVPAFPFVVVNVAPALLGVSFRVYLIGTLVGILPATYAFAYFGAGLGSAIESQHQAQMACLARQAAEPALDCSMRLDTSALPRDELAIAFVVLALIALLPIVARRWCPARGD
ncbi:MAG: TVP38/TMEM64 family protein [Hyphomicrobiaceae bacterium]